MSLIHARHKAAKSNFTRRRMLLMIHERNLRRAWKRVHNFNLECLINSCDFLLPTAKQAAATFDRFAGENNEASVGGTRRKLSEHVSPVDNHALSSSCLEGSSGNRRHMLDACKSPTKRKRPIFVFRISSWRLCSWFGNDSRNVCSAIASTLIFFAPCVKSRSAERSRSAMTWRQKTFKGLNFSWFLVSCFDPCEWGVCASHDGEIHKSTPRNSRILSIHSV